MVKYKRLSNAITLILEYYSITFEYDTATILDSAVSIYNDIENISLAYTENYTFDGDIQPIEVIADLKDFTISTYLDGELVNKIGYNNIDNMINYALVYLDFNELVRLYID